MGAQAARIAARPMGPFRSPAMTCLEHRGQTWLMALTQGQMRGFYLRSTAPLCDDCGASRRPRGPGRPHAPSASNACLVSGQCPTAQAMACLSARHGPRHASPASRNSERLTSIWSDWRPRAGFVASINAAPRRASCPRPRSHAAPESPAPHVHDIRVARRAIQAAGHHVGQRLLWQSQPPIHPCPTCSGR